jgi:hypothetical protein
VNTTTPSAPRGHQDDVLGVRAQDRVASQRAHGGAPERRLLWQSI